MNNHGHNKKKQKYLKVSKKLRQISKMGILIGSIIVMTTTHAHANDDTKASFEDVKGMWFEKPIIELYNANIINGYSDHEFRPNNSVTRSEAAKILANTIEQAELDKKYIRPAKEFADVQKGKWYRPYVMDLYRYGITDGYSKNAYRPDEELNRAQMAKLLVETFDLSLVEGKQKKFKDVNPNKWYAQYIDILSSHGITNGTTQGTYNPNHSIPRSELVVMISRTLEAKGIELESGKTKPSKPVEKPSKPEKPVEDKPTVEDKPVVDEKPSKPSTPEKVVLKEVKVPFYDTYSKESELAINGAVISLYSSKEDYLKGKKPLDVQKPKGSLQYKNKDTGFVFKDIEPGKYYYHSENKGLAIDGVYSYFYKDSEGYITIHPDGSIDGRIELERIHQIPHINDKDFSSPEKVKATKEYFIQRVNGYRKENDLKPLDFWSNPDIQDIADERAKHLEKHYGHDMPDGSAIRTFFASYNEDYRQKINEAILRNAVNAEHAFRMWKGSPGHNYILLSMDEPFSGTFSFENHAGIGVHQGKDGMTYFSLNVYKKQIR